MQPLFAKTFTGSRPRRPGDLRAKPLDVEVFEIDGKLWIRALRLAPVLGISSSALRQALRTSPEFQDDRHNQLVSLAGESGGPVRMLTIEGARHLMSRSQARRRVAVKAFLDEIEKR